VHRDLPLFRGQPQWIGRRARLLRGAKYACHDIASIEKGIEYCLAEISLSYNGNSHRAISQVDPLAIVIWQTL
jgi:hypothetical protein